MATLVLVKAIIIAQQLDFRGSSLCRERKGNRREGNVWRCCCPY